MEQTDPRAQRTSARLAFTNHVDRFVTCDRAPSTPEGAKMLAGFYPALDSPVILLQNVWNR
jgi:hypothetical protein